MKRDCGTGELIPTSYEVVFTSGMSDRERVTKHATLAQALAHYNNLTSLPEFSRKALYAVDRARYMNCILSQRMKKGQWDESTNRLSEL